MDIENNIEDSENIDKPGEENDNTVTANNKEENEITIENGLNFTYKH